MIRLTVQGSRFEASRAVTERGIVTFARSSVQLGATDQWSIDCPDSEENKIDQWFEESNSRLLATYSVTTR
jgi:hypothetical protein